MTIHALKHGLALCGAGRPADWPVGDRWVSYQDHAAHALTTCAGCLDALGPPVRTIHLTSAALLPPIEHGPGFVQRLAAMARPPSWVIDITAGRPAGAYANGEREVELMGRAIAERANTLLRWSEGGAAWAAYTAALNTRWSRLVDTGALAPGVWSYTQYEAPTRPDGYEGRLRAVEDGRIREVPTECYVVCTCREHEGCHLRIFAPHLRRAGWNVTLYGATVP